MTSETEIRLKPFTDYFDLEVVYRDDLPDAVPGLLESNAGLIVLNAHRPSLEHAFTIAHEIGHYVMHQSGKPKFPLPWFLNREWEWKWARLVTRKAKIIRHEKFGKEWEADFWAFVMLLHLGALTELQFVFETYPEKRLLFFLSILALMLGAGRQLEKNLLLSPLRAAEFLQSAFSSGRPRDDRRLLRWRCLDAGPEVIPRDLQANGQPR